MHFTTIITIFIGISPTLGEPCAEVSASWAAQATTILTCDHRALVPAQLAFDCLMSVPVDIEGDVKEIEELKDFLQFQSTLSYLKRGRYLNYQDEAHNEPIDLEENLDDMIKAIKNRTYQSDYLIQLGIHGLLRRTGDFYLRFQPDILEIFLFIRPGSQLVSIS
jgi:hypothetical protein